MKIDLESSSAKQKDYDFLKALNDYYNNSMGTNVEKISNFTKYIRTQDLRNFVGRYEILKKTINIPGSIVECATAPGS